MDIYRFGAGCFDSECSEETISLMSALKADYEELKDFAIACVRKQWEWESESNYTCQKWEDRFKLFSFRPATSEEIDRAMYHMNSMKWVQVQLDKLNETAVVFEPEWDSLTCVFEGENMYYFLEWYTTA